MRWILRESWERVKAAVHEQDLNGGLEKYGGVGKILVVFFLGEPAVKTRMTFIRIFFNIILQDK